MSGEPFQCNFSQKEPFLFIFALLPALIPCLYSLLTWLVDVLKEGTAAPHASPAPCSPECHLTATSSPSRGCWKARQE